MTKIIATIQGADILRNWRNSTDEIVRFTAGMMIDSDGSGSNPDNDPYFQSDTSLHRDGKALDADAEPFIVVPPVICQKTAGIVLGSLALVRNIKTEAWCFAVVGDKGPSSKIGEASPACAVLVDVPDNARTGGVTQHIIEYTIFVGIPAVVDGRRYVLQKYHA